MNHRHVMGFIFKMTFKAICLSVNNNAVN